MTDVRGSGGTRKYARMQYKTNVKFPMWGEKTQMIDLMTKKDVVN